MRTVKQFKQHDRYGNVEASWTLEHQINQFCDEQGVEVVSVSFINYHMSTSLEALVIFEDVKA